MSISKKLNPIIVAERIRTYREAQEKLNRGKDKKEFIDAKACHVCKKGRFKTLDKKKKIYQCRNCGQIVTPKDKKSES